MNFEDIDFDELERDFASIIEFWFREFDPPLKTKVEREYAKKNLEKYLYKKWVDMLCLKLILILTAKER